MIVMKFGGTSVRDAVAIDRACRIVADRIDQAPLVVVSAMSGVTSNLLEMSRLAAAGRLTEALSVYDRVRGQHLEMLDSLEGDLEELRATLKLAAQGRDHSGPGGPYRFVRGTVVFPHLRFTAGPAGADERTSTRGAA